MDDKNIIFNDDDDMVSIVQNFFTAILYSGQTFINWINDTIYTNDYIIEINNQILEPFKTFRNHKKSFETLEIFFYSLSINRQQKLKCMIKKNDADLDYYAFAIFSYIYITKETNIIAQVVNNELIINDKKIRIIPKNINDNHDLLTKKIS